jgi:hypothetical protein
MSWVLLFYLTIRAPPSKRFGVPATSKSLVFELRVEPDGKITGVYHAGIEKLAEAMGGEVRQVCRLSNVEWEETREGKGWTVRDARDPERALRGTCDDPKISLTGPLCFFADRDLALAAERLRFWALLDGATDVV